jgi:hypothetical protein
MRHPKLIIAGIGVALAAAGGTTAAVVKVPGARQAGRRLGRG